MTSEGKRLRWMAGAALVGAVWVAYFPALRAGFVLDDDVSLTQSRLVHAADGLYRFWCTLEASDYWPVTWTTFWIEWRLWGVNAMGYHATNLLLHSAEVVLLWAVLARLRIPGAFLAALLFAVHPVNVESVAWIAQRKNLMAMLFYLASILGFLRADAASPAAISGRWYWLSLAAFLLGMLSKGSVAILPIVLLGLVAWRRPLRLRDAARAAPFFLIAAVLTFVNVRLQGRLATDPFRTAGFTERLLGAAAAVWFYLSKALWPANLNFVYPQWRIRVDDPAWWLPLLAAAALTATLIACRRRWSREALFAWGYFCVCLVPVMGFVDISYMKFSLVADHYQHLAIIGVIAFAAAGWARAWAGTRGAARAGVGAAAAAAVCALSVLTWRQCGIYAGAETIYRATLKRNPDCWMADNNLAQAIVGVPGRQAEAIRLYEAAIRSKPDYAQAHNNLGAALAAIPQRREEAIEHYRTALRIQPDFPVAQSNLGSVLMKIPGRETEAIAHYEEALRLEPDDADVHSNLGAVLASIPGRREEAIRHCEAALRIKPGFAQAHYNLGVALSGEPGREGEAITQYEEALRINPLFAEAHSNLGAALIGIPGRQAEAIAQYEAALRIRPDYAEAHYNLASALADIPGRRAEAVSHCEAALRINPRLTPARTLLERIGPGSR